MNLTIAELADLPLAAAVVDGEGQLIGATPEWRGAGPGCVSYPVRSNRLVVGTAAATPECQELIDRLLDAMGATAHRADGRQARRIAMLAASLRLVAGRTPGSSGTSEDVIEHALAGIAVRTGLGVTVEPGTVQPVAAPEVAALVLVQVAANAERHAGATEITLSASTQAFHVSWRERRGAGDVVTSRSRAGRRGWGLGFARIAADALGGMVYPPVPGEGGTVSVTLEVGLRRLALPLAVLEEGRVRKATRAWDEETGCPPGTDVWPGSRQGAAAAAAAGRPGAIALERGIAARQVGGSTWLAIPPSDASDRARDVVDGAAHERALWDGVPEPQRSRVFALASLLAASLGEPLPRVPAHAWRRASADLWPAFGVRYPVPKLDAIGAVDPRIVAFLATEVGDGFDTSPDGLYLRLHPDRLGEPLIRVLRPEGCQLRIS